MNSRPLVLVTGALGRIAQKVMPYLAENFDLRLIDRVAAEVDGREILATDITDLDAMIEVSRGVDAVLHLAIASNREFVTDVARFERDEGEEYLRFNQATIEVNLRGTYNVLESARMVGAKRVVYGSSLTVLLGQESLTSLSDELPPKPLNFYGVTKLWGEQLGEYFSRAHGLRFFGLRLGVPHPQPEHPKYQLWLADPLSRSLFVTYEDLAGAMQCALQSDASFFECFTVVSASDDALADVSKGLAIGWAPASLCHADGSISKVA